MDQYCLNCANWERNDDPCIGKCAKIKGWFFQFEGDDCKQYEYGAEREPKEPGYVPPPLPHSATMAIEVIENNAEKVLKLRKAGRSYYNIAQIIGLKGSSREAVRRWLIKQAEKDKMSFNDWERR